MDPNLRRSLPDRRRLPKIRRVVVYDPVMALLMILMFIAVTYNLTILPLAYIFERIDTKDSETYELVAKIFKLVEFLVGMMSGLVFFMLILVLMAKIRAWLARRRAIANALACFPRKHKVSKLQPKNPQAATGGKTPTTDITMGGLENH